MPNNMSPIREKNIINRQPDGSNPVEKFEIGMNTPGEGLLMIAANVDDQIFVFPSPKAALDLYKISAPRTRVERTPAGGTLVPVGMLLPISQYPLLARVISSCISFEASRRQETFGKQPEIVTVSYEIFQRETEGGGEIREVRFGVSDGQMDADKFFELVEPEVGSKTVQSAIDFVCEHNRKAKADYKKFIDSLPPLPDPAKASAEIIAAGFKLAMEQMGLAAKAQLPKP